MNLAPHFKLSVEPIDEGLLCRIRTFDESGQVEEKIKTCVDTDELRLEIAKLFV